jgi:glutamine amidotransferase-like uncharacterized protein
MKNLKNPQNFTLLRVNNAKTLIEPWRSNTPLRIIPPGKSEH